MAIAIKMAMISTTTMSSMSVNPSSRSLRALRLFNTVGDLFSSRGGYRLGESPVTPRAFAETQTFGDISLPEISVRHHRLLEQMRDEFDRLDVAVGCTRIGPGHEAPDRSRGDCCLAG